MSKDTKTNATDSMINTLILVLYAYRVCIPGPSYCNSIQIHLITFNFIVITGLETLNVLVYCIIHMFSSTKISFKSTI